MIALAAAALLAQSQPFIPNGSWRMYGAANESCGEWLANKDDQARRLSQIAWVGGFLSGINLSAGGRLTDVDVLSLVAHIDQQCTVRPLERVAGIAVDFFIRARPGASGGRN